MLNQFVNQLATDFFKTREKAILARGEEFNYVADYPQDLYIYDNKSKKSSCPGAGLERSKVGNSRNRSNPVLISVIA